MACKDLVGCVRCPLTCPRKTEGVTPTGDETLFLPPDPRSRRTEGVAPTERSRPARAAAPSVKTGARRLLYMEKRGSRVWSANSRSHEEHVGRLWKLHRPCLGSSTPACHCASGHRERAVAIQSAQAPRDLCGGGGKTSPPAIVERKNGPTCPLAGVEWRCAPRILKRLAVVERTVAGHVRSPLLNGKVAGHAPLSPTAAAATDLAGGRT